jgi:hypothetical protein
MSPILSSPANAQCKGVNGFYARAGAQPREGRGVAEFESLPTAHRKRGNGSLLRARARQAREGEGVADFELACSRAVQRGEGVVRYAIAAVRRTGP